MKLIARAEQVGLTWPGTTRKANDQCCNNLKHNRTTITVQSERNKSILRVLVHIMQIYMYTKIVGTRYNRNK